MNFIRRLNGANFSLSSHSFEIWRFIMGESWPQMQNLSTISEKLCHLGLNTVTW